MRDKGSPFHILLMFNNSQKFLGDFKDFILSTRQIDRFNYFQRQGRIYLTTNYIGT